MLPVFFAEALSCNIQRHRYAQDLCSIDTVRLRRCRAARPICIRVAVFLAAAAAAKKKESLGEFNRFTLKLMIYRVVFFQLGY